MTLNTRKKDAFAFWMMLTLLALGYGLLSLLTDGDLFCHEFQDSYTEQALNWLHGRAWLLDGERYTWLELAIYDGKYWCSFPPLPSVVLLPLVLIFGQNTPNNLLVGVYGLVSAALAWKLMRKLGREPWVCSFWGAFLVWGSNMLWMTTYGGVWFQAQALCMLLCLAAILAALHDRRFWCLTLLALALGYYKNPAKTEEVFVRNPLNAAYPELIYRTGDLVRIDENGQMVYVSRKDFQVKHMGHRIEMGEIEAVMNAAKDVDRAVCVYDHAKSRILAWYTGGASKEELTAELKETLPQYMLPNRITHCDAMPLNKNGKIDRECLKNAYK